MTLRDYTTISVSMLDQGVAAFALSKEVLPKVLERNIALCKQTISIVDDFVSRNSQRCSWVKPHGAGVAFIKLFNLKGEPLDDKAFSTRLAEEEGISSVPGELCFSTEDRGDFKGYVRLTLGEPERLRKHLHTIEAVLHKSE